METLNGNPIPGTFSMQRLWRFILREGTQLAEEQEQVEEHCCEEEEEERRREAKDIRVERGARNQDRQNPLQTDDTNTSDGQSQGRSA